MQDWEQFPSAKLQDTIRITLYHLNQDNREALRHVPGPEQMASKYCPSHGPLPDGVQPDKVVIFISFSSAFDLVTRVSYLIHIYRSGTSINTAG